MNDDHLFVVMVGLPARGKSTIAGKLYESLRYDGIKTRIFNNGDLRRRLSKENSSFPEYFNPQNRMASEQRERFAMMNVHRAKTFIQKHRDQRAVAILDAANVSPVRRKHLRKELPEDRTLFIECIHDDPEILEAGIRLKIQSPEFSGLSQMSAVSAFKERIQYYERDYKNLGPERNYYRIDSFNYRMLKAKLTDNIPFADRIRDYLVTTHIKNLFLVRHPETFDNLDDRIGGDADLTAFGRTQAKKLARHFSKWDIPLIFTSSLKRTLETSMYIKAKQKDCRVLPFTEFDEINAGICEGMTYNEVREQMPNVYASRRTKKYRYVYPKGEGYVTMEKRIERGIKKVLFFSKYPSNALIVGHRAVNRMILAYFVFKRKEDVPYIYIPQDRYYRIAITHDKKVFEMKKFG